MPRITELPQATGLGASDLLVKDDGSTTQKLPVNKAYASAEQPGMVSTTGQTIKGVKTFDDTPRIRSGSQYQSILFVPNNAPQDTYYGSIYLNAGGDSLPSRSQIGFSERSVSAATGDVTGFVENYALPACDMNRQESAAYSILTNKNPVTIAQGGTGQTATITQTLATGLVLRSWGRCHNLQFTNVDISNLVDIPTGYRPSSQINGTLRVKYTDDKYYLALVTITSAGAISFSRVTAANGVELISDGSVMGSVNWIVGG